MRGLTGLIVVLAAGLAFAGEETKFPAKYMQEQEFFEGHWSGEGKIGDDEAKIDFRAKWLPGRHSLLIQGTTRRGKKGKPVQWTILSGCDTATGEMVDCLFSADGDRAVTRWKTVSDKVQEGTETGLAYGKKYTSDCRAEKINENKWVFTTTTPGGKPVKMEYTRVDVLAAGKDDSLWEEYRKRTAGTWDGKGTVSQDLEELGLAKGDEFSYWVEWSEELDGRVLTGEGMVSFPSRGKEFGVRLLCGWDPEKRHIRLLAIFDGGLFEEIILTRFDAESFYGTYSGTFPGRETTRQRIRRTFLDKYTEEIVFLDGPLKGEPLSTWKRRK